MPFHRGLCRLLALVLALAACAGEAHPDSVISTESDDAATPDATVDAGSTRARWHASDRPSCAAETLCGEGDAETSCCDAQLLAGGTFSMGRCDRPTPSRDSCSDGIDDLGALFSGSFSDELPEHGATVSAFYLDTFEVTVERYRRFVTAYEAGYRPEYGAGAISGVAESGWDDQRLGALVLGPLGGTGYGCDRLGSFSARPSDQDRLPMNCVNWFAAFAFCIWDGGRLPTEAEWEYAAAGGYENRRYPWGSADANTELAVHGCAYDGDDSCSLADLLAPGSRPEGRGRFGQHDLAGSVAEWVFDWYDGGWYGAGGRRCVDCARATPLADDYPYRVQRGGSFTVERGEMGQVALRSTHRDFESPNEASRSVGFRCARSE